MSVEPLSEEEARKIVDATRRSIRAYIAGDRHSEDARAMSLQVETYQLRAAAERAAGAALPDFRDAYRSEVDKALAKGLRQEVAHELGLFATYLVGKAAGRAARALAADRETEE